MSVKGAAALPRAVIRGARRTLRAPRRVYHHLRRLHLEAGHVRRLARYAVFLEEGGANIRRRLEGRTDALMETVERAVFGHPQSPYRPLLETAGHDFDSVRLLIRSLGVEEALRRLCADGVYVAIEEFKGNRDARRGGRTFHFEPADFDNPLVRSGLSAASGGTRSNRIPTTISIEDHNVGVEHFAAALDAYGLSGKPAAVWVAHGHGASLWAVAALAALRAPSMEWFTLLKEGTMFLSLLTRVARLYGVALPRLTYAPFHEAPRVLAWVRTTAAASGACGILTMPSLALRLAWEARARGLTLDNVTFITIGEPLTGAKLEAIRGVGGRAFSSLGFTEFGRATYGCARPVGPDDTHVCRDSIAVIQRRRPVDHLGTEVDALLFTALWPHARKILLNTETGDYASIVQRPCGCSLEALGWTEHLQDIRSFEKLNAVGRLFFGSALYALIEEELPARFGGHATDYQLLEEEDAEGFTRLTILLHPRLGPLDEQAVLQCVEGALRGISERQTDVWRDAEVLRVRRAPPVVTAAGKLMPLHHLSLNPPPLNRSV